MAKFLSSVESDAFFDFNSVYGLPTVPAGSDAVRVFNARLLPSTRDLQPINESGHGRSVVASVAARERARAGISMYCRPASASGSAPPGGDILKLAMGKETTTNVEVEYGLITDASGLHGSLFVKDNLGHVAAVGWVISSFTLSWSSEGPAVWTFDGPCMSVRRFLPTETDGASVTADRLEVEHPGRVGIGNVIDVDNNGASIVEEEEGDVRILSTSQTWADGDDVDDGLPSASYGTHPDPLFATVGSLSLDGGTTDVKFVSGQLSVQTGNTLINSESGTVRATGALSAARRRVSFRSTFAAKEEVLDLLAEARDAPTKDTILTLGPAGNPRLKIEMEKMQISSPVESPNAEGVTTAEISGVATTTGSNNELTLTYRNTPDVL